MGLLGAAIDLGSAYKQREQLLIAADSASLVAVSQGSPGLLAAAAMTADGPAPAAESEAVKAFYGEVNGQDAKLQPHATSIVTKAGMVVTSTMDFTVDMPTHFLELFGLPWLTINGHATSVSGTPAFVDFYLLLDNSPSMGVAATPADIALLKANTLHTAADGEAPNGCAFACHESDYPGAAHCVGGVDCYTVAKNTSVTLRIDVLRQATQKLMDTAAVTASAPKQFRMAIDTFNLTTQAISPLTANLAAAKADANAIDLMSVNFQGENNDRFTDLGAALDATTLKVPSSDTGTDAAHTQKVVFLVTDGVTDQQLSTADSIVSGANSQLGGDRLIQTADPAQCAAMKAKSSRLP